MLCRCSHRLWSPCSQRSAQAAVSAAAFDSANKLYEEGKFAEAVSAYEKLAQSGQVSAALYFNLGNAFFKSGQIGRAIAAYRDGRANHPARPGPARQPAVRAQPNAQPDAVAQPLAALARPADPERMDPAGGGRGLALAAPAGDPAMAARPQTGAPRAMSSPWPCWPRLLCACAAAALRETRFTRTAIVVTREATVRYGPLAESPTAFTVHDGAELRVLDQKDEWLQVSAGPRRIGWLRRDQVVIAGR